MCLKKIIYSRQSSLSSQCSAHVRPVSCQGTYPWKEVYPRSRERARIQQEVPLRRNPCSFWIRSITAMRGM